MYYPCDPENCTKPIPQFEPEKGNHIWYCWWENEEVVTLAWEYKVPRFVLKHLWYFNVNVYNKEPLHPKFKSTSKLVPVIFSHGLKMNKQFYANVCWELAAHGCAVYAIDHEDSTCTCTYRPDKGFT